MSSDRRYTQEEVDAILKRALERDGAKGKKSADALSHQDLLETAREVGIEPAQIEAAIAEVKLDNEKLSLREAWLARRREQHSQMVKAWAFVNVICFTICMVTGATWWPWVLVPWGGVIILNYLALRRSPTDKELAQLDRKLEREQRKRELEARFARGAQALGTVVEEGARLLAAHFDERARRIESGRQDERSGRLPPKR